MKKPIIQLSIYTSIALAVFFLYNGFQENYFFSDDFQWLAQAIQTENSPGAIFQVRGRDFNPLLSIFFWIVIKIGGISPMLLRIICFIIFSAVLFVFYYILSRYFAVNRLTALCAALLAGFNVFISEVLLYISTFVYALTLLLFFIALKFYLDGKKILFLLFMLAAFQVKETIILAVIALFFYEKQRNNRVFLVISSFFIILTRVVFQVGEAGSYTNFAVTENILYKSYFLILHALNLSPYAMNLSLGIGIILILIIIFIYYSKQMGQTLSLRSFKPAAKDHIFFKGQERNLLFFGLFFVIYILFFSFLPRLSSKYYFYPCFAFWGSAALLLDYFYKRSKLTRYFLVLLVIISLFFNYPAVKREIEDYKILGNFSRNFIEEQGKIIKNTISLDRFAKEAAEVRIEKVSDRALRRVYDEIYNRGNMLKLLPVREHSLGGVLLPGDLLVIIYYPGWIVRWQPIKETDRYFLGTIEIIRNSSVLGKRRRLAQRLTGDAPQMICTFPRN